MKKRKKKSKRKTAQLSRRVMKHQPGKLRFTTRPFLRLCSNTVGKELVFTTRKSNKQSDNDSSVRERSNSTNWEKDRRWNYFKLQVLVFTQKHDQLNQLWIRANETKCMSDFIVLFWKAILINTFCAYFAVLKRAANVNVLWFGIYYEHCNVLWPSTCIITLYILLSKIYNLLKIIMK